ncbi:MAG: 50S ribosomal protein L21 [Candidatus Paracaedimonas acanthamoebae]|uniref:Large ribosomal subunit protein bL21 n=1 Tax=Candidatus Paracaedimonas acanthamoebae TaxID=244581 RepID=A0A8J7TTF2_9PROT|nr:50S ribosomal protein L21 [Candidatus Paracaedimonas acanthamoebae]
MFAVIKTGGKQYKVSNGDVVKVERLEGEAGATLHLSDILMLGEESKMTVGAPVVQDAAVRATILEQARADKIIVFKKRRRQGYRRKAGHRQDLTVLRIEEVIASGAGSLPKYTAPKGNAVKSPSSDEKAPKVDAAPKATAKAKPAGEEKVKKASVKKETKK